MRKFVMVYKKYFLSFCMIFGCWIFPGKAHAFDYKTYSKEVRQMRSLTPVGNTLQPTEKSEKKSKSRVLRVIAEKLLEALDSDLVPAKMFKATNSFSFYLKPAKITKLGIKYKF